MLIQYSTYSTHLFTIVLIKITFYQTNPTVQLDTFARFEVEPLIKSQYLMFLLFAVLGRMNLRFACSVDIANRS